ncbi:MAG: patatin-like phospholipase family protein [candidate division WOR-3 bacterium]|nr:patatin-like phospholipase family protein [candidate division WOR-3 bacterium]
MKNIFIFLILFLLIFQISFSQEIKIGLALSGGAALGLAHIGVLKVLEREGIPISFIIGNSMGSLVGGVYSAGYSAFKIESIALSANWQELFSNTLPFGSQYLPERQLKNRYFLNLNHKTFIPYLPSGLIPLQNVEFLLARLLSEVEYYTYYDFDSLPISYRAIAVNLKTGEKVALRKGRLAKAIRASIAIPGVFPPEIIDGEEYVDGGVKEYLPVEPLLEFSPDFIIAVITKKKAKETGGSLIDIVSRSIDIVTEEDLEKQKKLADIVIEPNVERFSHSDFHRAKELIAVGESACQKVLPEIKEKLKDKVLYNKRKEIKRRELPFIRQIKFEGLKRTKPYLFKGRLKTINNKKLNFRDLLKDLNYLFHTDLFEEVDYRLEFVNKESCDIIFELKEKVFGFYSLGIRYDIYDNIILGLEIGEGNIFGTGASLRTSINLGNPNEIRIGLIGTRLFQFPFGYRIDGFYGSLNRNYFKENKWQGYYLIRYLGSVSEIGYILGKDAFFNIGIKAEKNIYKIPFSNSFPKSEWIIGPSFKLEFNNFDNLFLPKKGENLQINTLLNSKKLKASKDFFKLELFYKRIIPLNSFFLFNYSLDLGFSFLDLAFSEYFYSGGENFIGFEKEEFTTKYKGIFKIGFDFKIFNLFKQEDYPLYWQLIFNIGTFERFDKLSEKEFKEIFHWGIGTGIKTNTPIGPLNFIFGVGNFSKNEKTKFQFITTFGKEFRYKK